jgi:hypothetical protein
VDNAWEQEKPEARKMLENGDESHLSSARFVRRFFSRLRLSLLALVVDNSLVVYTQNHFNGINCILLFDDSISF